ncbi:MAG: SURF1 family protein [Paracoccaceae bacterium]|nr:SURF1 family protein [Paracoccaceae bacterium]
MAAATDSQTEGGAWRRPRVLGALAFTLAGVAILLGLMTWQVQRLAWKEGLIALLEARLAEPPLDGLPEAYAPDLEFRRVALSGRFTGAPGAHGFADVARLTTVRPWGPGYRVIQPFETAAGRVVLVDRGYVPVAEKNVDAAAARATPAPEGRIDLVATLRWPDDRDFFADPEAGPADNVWLTREVARLAPLWDAEPVLLVAETDTATGAWPRPLPTSVDLPNDHLEYAVTWASLAAIWAACGALLVRREARRAPAG